MLSNAAKQTGPGLSAIPRYLSAVLSQGLVSGFHFVLNLLLVKLLSLTDFGIYALTFVAAVMAAAISNALVSTPLCVYAPSAKSDQEREQIQTMLTTLMSLLVGAGLALGLIASFTFADQSMSFYTLLAATGFVASYLARQYSRSFGYSRFDVIGVLYGDTSYVVSGAVLISLTLWNSGSLSAAEVFSLLTLANLLAILVELKRLPFNMDVMNVKRAMDSYRHIWLQSRWALIGAVTTIVVSQAHSIVVSLLKSPAAYAPLAAGFVIFGPVRVVFSTIQNVLKPEMALAVSNHHYSDARRQMLAVSGLSLLAVIGLAVLTLLFWPFLSSYLYAEQYAHAPMQQIVALWAGITMIAAIQNGPFTALQAMKKFRPLALSSVYGSILSLVLVTLAVTLAPVQWSILGILLAEGFVAAWVVILSLRCFRQSQSKQQTSVDANTHEHSHSCRGSQLSR
ncbi:MAG: hypothetical protein KTR35_10825 [Gammaproteobacteria bacterium]|nr:hypothetical protein [Gammaproteobacteria bacterium]